MTLVDLSILKYGLIRGRDSINIIEIKSSDQRKFEIIVSMVNDSLSDINKSKQVNLKIIFDGVVLYKIFDENIRGILNDEEFEMYSESKAESVFMEIKNSTLAEKNKNAGKSHKLRHIIIETYDFKVECLCETFLVEEIF